MDLRRVGPGLWRRDSIIFRDTIREVRDYNDSPVILFYAVVSVYYYYAVLRVAHEDLQR